MKQRLEKERRTAWISRLPAMVVGGILVAAAFLKAVDPLHFIAQMRGYGIIGDTDLLAPAAWALITIEMTLGWSLIVSYRPRITLPLSIGLLTAFIGLGVYAWVTGATEDCGCFGSLVKRSPRAGVAEGTLMLLALLFSLAFSRPAEKRPRPSKAWSVALACLAGIVFPGFFGLMPSAQEGGAFIRADRAALSSPLNNLGIEDLSSGIYLVVLMDTDCASCKGSVEAVNELAVDQDLPEVIALAANNEARRMAFTELNKVDFPLVGIGEDDFWRLLGTGDIPRTLLVRDGKILRVWEQKVPVRETLLKAMNVI